MQTFETRGKLHTEGGWPREINPKDEEQIERYRKRTQRDDVYVHVMQKLTERMEHAILQNIVLNIYKTCLENEQWIGHRSEATMNMTHVCRPITPSRVRNISWRQESIFEIAVTMDKCESLIWNLINPNEPTSITANSPMTTLKYFINDNRLVSGLEDGRIAIWDKRSGGEPLSVSAPEFSHRDAVVSLIWTAGKSGSEFFTASSDGMIKWWDCTKLRKPTSELFVGEPLTSLEYDPNIPTKFLMGTADGHVICGSRRKDGEALPWRMKVSDGPVVGLARNPAFPKILLTVGGKMVKIWSEDCRHANLFSTAAAPADILTAQWSPTRCCVIGCGRLDNFIDIWDLSERRYGPIYSIRNGPNVAVTALAFQDEGKYLAIGTADGSMYVYQIPKYLTTITSEEKSQTSEMFDREVHREKLIEAKLREIQLKLKDTKAKQDEGTTIIETIDYQQRRSWLDQIKNNYLIAVDEIILETSTDQPSASGDANALAD